MACLVVFVDFVEVARECHFLQIILNFFVGQSGQQRRVTFWFSKNLIENWKPKKSLGPFQDFSTYTPLKPLPTMG